MTIRELISRMSDAMTWGELDLDREVGPHDIEPIIHRAIEAGYRAELEVKDDGQQSR